MSSLSLEVTLYEPESNWHLCSYRGWLIAVLPTEQGFAFEYLAPDGESRGAARQSYACMIDAIRQAKKLIKRKVTIGLIDQWLSELQDQETIDMKEYCRLFQSLHQYPAE